LKEHAPDLLIIDARSAIGDGEAESDAESSPTLQPHFGVATYIAAQ
jgi:hypothetical protein